MARRPCSSDNLVIPMKFCPECNNLLYPKEDKQRKILLNACRTCSYTVLPQTVSNQPLNILQEVAESNCVYRNVVQRSSAPAVILRDAYADPTLPRIRGAKCPVCAYPEVAIFL
ncbi:DNA-directed RNA polymerases II, IV and V subunit 9A-like, partial [Phalaenopsis equestris]|uniref:DNA-directed RNA polymerases II, IV and V subunit 9A-like n=1 Tax=Phalaenopsis equestris TaxID=78828 RepID=UPI0009E26E9B